MITLTNSFHNTSVRIRAEPGGYLTESQVRRARAHLCGIKCCVCGGPLGERGGRYRGVVAGFGPDGTPMFQVVDLREQLAESGAFSV